MVAPSWALDTIDRILVKGVSIIKLRLRPQMVKLSLHYKHTRRMRLLLLTQRIGSCSIRFLSFKTRKIHPEEELREG